MVRVAQLVVIATHELLHFVKDELISFFAQDQAMQVVPTINHQKNVPVFETTVNFEAFVLAGSTVIRLILISRCCALDSDDDDAATTTWKFSGCLTEISVADCEMSDFWVFPTICELDGLGFKQSETQNSMCSSWSNCSF